jgi:hypothetical protein
MPSRSFVGLVLGVMGFLLIGYLLLLGVMAATSTGNFSTFTSALARFGGTGVACLMLIGVALRAAGTLTTERDRQSLDGLLTCDLENRSILFGKWLGSILSVRKGWLFLGPVWVLAAVSGGIQPLALPLLVFAWAAYAAFAAGLGVFFSLISRSTLAATLSTMLVVVGFFGGHRGLWLLYEMSWSPRPVPERFLWIGDFLLYGFTPPLSLGVLSFRSHDFVRGAPMLLTWQMVVYAMIGAGCFGAGAALIWKLLLNRFGPVTGRMPLPQAVKTMP